MEFRKLIVSSITSFLCCFSLTGLANICQLGSPCTVPDYSGQKAKVIIAPADGKKYICFAQAHAHSFRFVIEGGGNFNMEEGEGYYNANPFATIVISGRFNHPENEFGYGTIKLIPDKYPGYGGTFTCYIA